MAERDAVVLESAVSAAQGLLAGGKPPREVLTDLWRAAYACGVGQGQRQVTTESERVSAAWKPSRAVPGDRVPERADGWVWGVHADLEPGGAFRYGGTDPEKPTADREAMVALRLVRGRMHMTLADSGETVALPVLFWARREV